MRSPAKLKDVAEMAGVSVTTVSRVLNRARGVERIPAACIDRVETAAKSLGYRTSYLARSFQTGTSDGIGVTQYGTEGYVPLHAFGAAYYVALDSAIRGASYHQVTIGPAHGLTAAERGVAFLKERRIDGLVMPVFNPSSEDLRILESIRAPIVIIGRAEATSIPSVELDHGDGIRQAVVHLAGLGHRTVGWVGPVQAWAAADVRRATMNSISQAHGMAAEDIVVVPTPAKADSLVEIDDARRAVLTALRAKPQITAIVCYNDIFALGAYRGIADVGLRVPQDVSVIGFDDVYGCVAAPPLTTVSHMINEMSEQGIRCLVEILKNPEAWEQMRGRRCEIRPRLVIRESTASKRS